MKIRLLGLLVCVASATTQAATTLPAPHGHDDHALVHAMLADATRIATASRGLDDYALVNAMLADVTIPIPRIETVVQLGPLNALLKVWSLNCSRLAVGDLSLEAAVSPNGRTVTITGAVREFQIACHGRWSIDFGYYEEGEVSLSTQTASIGVAYEVPALDAVHNTQAAWIEMGAPLRMDVCDASMPLEIDMMVGGIVATLVSVEALEDALLGFVQGDINGALCDALDGPISESLREALGSAKDFLDPYVGRAFENDMHRAAETAEAEQHVRSVAAAQNVTLVSLAYNASTGLALGAPGPLPGESQLAAAGNALTAAAQSEGGRQFAVQPLLQALSTVIGLAADAITGAGALSIGGAAFGSSEGVFVLGGANETQILLQVVEVTLGGLETFAVTQATTVVGDYTLSHAFEVAELRLEVRLALGVAPPGGDTSLAAVNAGAVPMQSFSVSAGLDELNLEVDAILALAEQKLNNLQLGSIAVAPIGCLLETIFGVVLSHLSLRVADVRFPVVVGFVNPALDEVLTTLSQSVESVFEDALLAALPALVEDVALEPANAAIATALAGLPTSLPDACPAVPPAEPAGSAEYVDFGSNQTGAELLLQRALAMANDMVADDESGYSPLNAMIRDALASPALLRLGGVEVEMPPEFYGLAHTIELVALNLSIVHLDTIHGVGIHPLAEAEAKAVAVRGRAAKEAGAANTLRATGAIGRAGRPLTLELYAKVNLYKAQGEWLYVPGSLGEKRKERSEVHTTEELRITLGASDVRLLLDLFLRISQQRLASLYASEALIWQCWVSTLAPQGLGIASFAPTLGALDVFEIECIHCDSPFFNTLAARAATPSARASMLAVLQQSLDAVGATAESKTVAALLDSVVAAAPAQCATLVAGGYVAPYGLAPAPLCEELEGTDMGKSLARWAAAVPWWHWLLAGLALSTLASLYLWWLLSRYRRMRRAGRRIERLNREARYQHHARAASLFGSRAVPWLAKLGVPLVLAGNAFLFVRGHLAIGATVDIYIQADGVAYNLPGYFTFSIAQSTIDMYNAGSVFLAFVVLIFSGIWPYVKLLCMCFLWFVPAWVVAPANRGSGFAWLDTLGKWSMIDIFVMVLSIVGFNVVINPPAAFNFLWEDLFRIELFVTPRWGLYANLLAQLVSQLSSHTCLFYHRRHLAHLAAVKKGLQRRDGALAPVEPPAAAGPHRPAGFLAPTDDELHKADLPALPRPAGFLAPTADELHKAELPYAKELCDKEGGPKGLCYNEGGPVAEEPTPAARRLAEHVYKVGESGRRFCVVTRAYVAWLSLALLGLPPLIVVGSVLPNLRIDYNGLVGLLMEAHEPGSHTKRFSILDLAAFIAAQANWMWEPELGVFMGVLGMYLVVVVLVLCIIVAPVLQCVALALLHLKRLSPAAQKHVYVAVEVVSAWSFQEVYIIAVALAMSQIETISRFLVQCFCNDLVPIFAALHQAGVLEKEFSECFYSKASVECAIWILLVSGLLLSLVTQVMMRTARVAFSEMRTREEGVRASQPWIQYWMLPGYVSLRRMLTHRLDLVDEASPAAMREAVARFLGAPPAFELGPWLLLWQADAGRAWYLHSVDGELRDARQMDNSFGATIAIALGKSDVAQLEEQRLGGIGFVASVQSSRGSARSMAERPFALPPPPVQTSSCDTSCRPASPPPEAAAPPMAPASPPPTSLSSWVSENTTHILNKFKV